MDGRGWECADRAAVDFHHFALQRPSAGSCGIGEGQRTTVSSAFPLPGQIKITITIKITIRTEGGGALSYTSPSVHPFMELLEVGVRL